MTIDSPLRRLPSNLDPKQARFLHAIRLTAEGIGIAYARLVHILTEIGDSRGKGDGNLAAAVLDAWSIVDSVHRLRVLVSHLPRYKNRAASKQGFMRATSEVDGLRNSIQHLGTDMDRLTADDLPVLGALTWIRPIDAQTGEVSVESIVPGQLAETRSLVQLPGVVPESLGQVELWAAGGHVNISHLHAAVGKLIGALEAPLTRQFAGAASSPSDAYVAVVVRLRPPGDPKDALPDKGGPPDNE